MTHAAAVYKWNSIHKRHTCGCSCQQAVCYRKKFFVPELTPPSLTTCIWLQNWTVRHRSRTPPETCRTSWQGKGPWARCWANTPGNWWGQGALTSSVPYYHHIGGPTRPYLWLSRSLPWERSRMEQGLSYPPEMMRTLLLSWEMGLHRWRTKWLNSMTWDSSDAVGEVSKAWLHLENPRLATLVAWWITQILV